ncbi:hypothetical protein BH23CHL2_BH23CHL2_26890 [soil metagenome]
MTLIKKTLIGLGLAIGLLALPLSAGAGTSTTLSNHRASTQELVERALYDPLATYMMIEMSNLEQVAGHKNLDQATIKFLEENIWDYEGMARGVGDPDDRTDLERIAGRKNLDQATIQFLEDNIWDLETSAGFARVDPEFLSEEELWFLEDNLWNYEINAEPEGKVEPVVRLTEEELQYLEENIWGYNPEAQFQQTDDTRIGVYDIDPDMFSEEILWQDAFDSTATFEGDRDDDVYPYPHEIPGLRAGELNY